MTENIEGSDVPKNSKDLRQWVGEMHARLAEEAKPKEIRFKFSCNDLIVVKEVIRLAMEHGGTTTRSRAIVDVCEYYLHRGPHVGVRQAIAIRHEMQKEKLEHLMKDLGSKESIEAFNRTFPARAVHFDIPQEDGQHENDE